MGLKKKSGYFSHFPDLLPPFAEEGEKYHAAFLPADPSLWRPKLYGAGNGWQMDKLVRTGTAPF